jgi:uncharacterized Tic20 family protein
MEGPRITRVLPRVDGETEYLRPESIARASMALSSVGLVTLFDDRVDTPDGAFPLNEAFGAGLRPDPRAPLTVDPPLGLGLVRAGGRWMTYMPRHEADAVHMLAAIERACAARGLTVEHPDTPPAAAAPVADRGGWPGEPGWRVLDAAPQPVWRPQVAEAPRFTAAREPEPQSVSAVLLAVTHLSLLFAPVLLPALVWASLRVSAPRLAAEAKRALRFQAFFYACALPILGAAVFLSASQHQAALALATLVAFCALLLAGAGIAFWAASRALGGHSFTYSLLPNPYATSL